MQIGVLNSANSKLENNSNMINVSNSEILSEIDSFLIDYANKSAVSNMIDSVIPALNITMQQLVEQEARKILYSVNYQEIMEEALSSLFAAENNQHLVMANLFLETYKEEFKDDAEIQELLSNRPQNIFMMKGKDSLIIKQKISELLESLVYEDPIEALQVI